MALAKDYDNHPRRCQARLKRRGGEQCKNWALRGSKYCKFHGGRMQKARGEVRIDHLPLFYRNHLSKTLTKAVEEMLAVAPEDQLSLFEELAIMRSMAGEAISLHRLADEGGKTNQKLAAGELMRHALKDVVQVCESAARVSASGKDKISVHDVQHIVHQIVRVAYSELDEKDAARFERALKRDVKLPVRNDEGTSLTPDMDVSEMDDTIPTKE